MINQKELFEDWESRYLLLLEDIKRKDDLYKKNNSLMESKKLGNLYHRINEMLEKLTLEGEINAQDSLVINVLDVLSCIDDGIYDEKFMIGPTIE